MNLQDVFTVKVLEKAKSLYNDDRVVILSEQNNIVTAVVFDTLFYYVTIEFNEDNSLKALSVTSDSKNLHCPISTPYAAALLVKLMVYGRYNLTCACQLPEIRPKMKSPSEKLATKQLADSRCFPRILINLFQHVIPLQNFRTDVQINSFSDALEHIFNYFDSLELPNEQWVAIQTFMHLYIALPFDFKNKEDVHYGVMDECNYRINKILEETPGPFTKSYFEMMLKSDTEILPYLGIYDTDKMSHNN